MITHNGHKFLTTTFASLTAVFLAAATPAVADDSASGSRWEYDASLYLWGASLNITTPTPPGADVEVPFYQILNDLKMVLMGEFNMRNDDWSIMTDVIYMKLKQKNILDPQVPIADLTDFSNSVQMKSWIVTPTVGYALHNEDNTRVEVFGGLRYLWMDLGLQIKSKKDTPVFDRSVSEGFWDGIFGFRARVGINDKWFVPASVDVGGGNSKATWQGIAGIGYDFGKYNTSLTYRYLYWKFNDVPALEKLVIKGPNLTFNYRF